MRKLIVVAALIASPIAALAAAATYSATDNGVKGVCASGTCDAPVEAGGLEDGFSLPVVGGLMKNNGLGVTVCADETRTLSGAGTLTAYVRDPSIGLWAAAPEFNMTVTSSGRRCQFFGGIRVDTAVGRITWVPTGVTVSAGGATVYISGK